MPICTNCTNPTPYLYTVYESAHNLRLEQCTKCHTFADPYVEHDTLILVLDLILLKRGVYRHLLFNRGSEPRQATGSNQKKDNSEDDTKQNQEAGESDGLNINTHREKLRWMLIVRLGGALVAVDAFIRWSHLNPDRPRDVSPWTRETIEALSRTLIGCLIETIAFHTGIMVCCYVMLTFLDWVRKHRASSIPASGIRPEFRFSLIPLTIFYSSLTKLFLLFLLTIWRPASSASAHDNDQPKTWNGTTYNNIFISSALEVFDDDKLDREWVVRNILGGMSAGFGLRVILDCHPFFTTIIILGGWAVKTAVANLVSGWVGGDEKAGETWLAYSIP